MRRIKLYCHDEVMAFTETYVEGERGSFTARDADLDAWAAWLIRNFNETLRPHEHARTLDRVEHLEAVALKDAKREHDWHKTNMVTIMDRVGVYDAMRCDRCGITGKRFGLGDVTRDSKFRAKKHEYCRQTP